MDSTLIVALALLGVCLVMTIVAMTRFPATTFFRFWAAFGPIFGGLVGTIGAYYFQANEVKKAQNDSARFAQVILDLQKGQEQVGTELASLEHKIAAPAPGGRPDTAGIAASVRTIRQQYETQQAHLGTAVRGIPRAMLSPALPARPKP